MVEPPSLLGAPQVITALVFPRVATTDNGALGTDGVVAAALEATPKEANTMLTTSSFDVRRFLVIILFSNSLALIRCRQRTKTSTQMHS